jgi:hypothetical protein
MTTQPKVLGVGVIGVWMVYTVVVIYAAHVMFHIIRDHSGETNDSIAVPSTSTRLGLGLA